MLLTYIGPHDEVEIVHNVGADFVAVGIVKRGDDVDVPDSVAGRPPTAGQVPARLLPLFEQGGLEALADLDDEVLELREDDELVDVVVDYGEGLLAQPSNYIPATGLDALTVGQLRAHAEERGIDLTGAKTKPQIIAAIRAHGED